MAVSAFELIVPIGASINVDGATEGAHNHFMPSLLSNEVSASFVGVEMADKRNQGIEVFKFKSHISWLLSIYIYQEYGEIFQKSPAFLRWASIISTIFGVN